MINLRKHKSEFLGFAIRADKKGKKRVAYSNLSEKKKKQYLQEGKKRIKQIQKNPTAQNALLYNSWVLGIHHYSQIATHVNPDLVEIAYQTKRDHLQSFAKC